MTLAGHTAIAGIGATEFSKNSGRSEYRLACEAVLAAVDDAGLRPADVDGLVTFTMDNTEEQAIAYALGLDRLTYFARTPYGGGGACGTVALAASAIVAGLAEVVVCYRAMNERSEQRLGVPGSLAAHGDSEPVPGSWDVDVSWTQPFGLASPAAWGAMVAQRYMHEYDVTSEDLGRVAVAARAFAATNPRAWYYERPISLADHQASRIVADPMRRLDCCQESDGAVALVVVSAERAASLTSGNVVSVAGVSQGMGPRQVGIGSYYVDDMGFSHETAVAGDAVFAQAEWGRDDIDVAILYDHFTPGVLMQLEALRLCERGGAAQFVRERGIGPGGALPVNTNGGQLGEAYIHGFNGIAEAVRQLRGSAANQIQGARRAVVTSGAFVPTSALLLEGT